MRERRPEKNREIREIWKDVFARKSLPSRPPVGGLFPLLTATATATSSRPFFLARAFNSGCARGWISVKRTNLPVLCLLSLLALVRNTAIFGTEQQQQQHQQPGAELLWARCYGFGEASERSANAHPRPPDRGGREGWKAGGGE